MTEIQSSQVKTSFAFGGCKAASDNTCCCALFQTFLVSFMFALKWVYGKLAEGPDKVSSSIWITMSVSLLYSM